MYGTSNSIIYTLQNMASHGLMGFCDNYRSINFSDAKTMLLYLIFVVAEIIAIIAGNYALKRFDCTK